MSGMGRERLMCHKGRKGGIQASRARTPSSHSCCVTHPVVRQTGHETLTWPSSETLSAPLSATRSALTKHALWNRCSQALAPSSVLPRIESCFMALTASLTLSVNGSSSDGPRPQLMSQQRRPASRSRRSTRWRSESPGAGGRDHAGLGPSRRGGRGPKAPAIIPGNPPNMPAGITNGRGPVGGRRG